MLTPDQARKMARETLASVSSGADPAGERQKARQAPTVTELCDRFLSEHVGVFVKASTAQEYTRLIEKWIKPELGSLKAEAITRQDILKIHRRMADTPRQANQTLAVLSKLFNLAELWEVRPEHSNPCEKLKRYPEVKRERFLSEGELTRLGEVLATSEAEERDMPGVIAAIRLLALTGCRLGEVLGLRWEYVDFEAGALLLPDSKTGARVHAIGAPALTLLAGLPKVTDCPWVIQGGRPGEPLNKYSLEGAWLRIRHRAGMDDVRRHDLRHTVGTYAGQTGANAFLVRDMLGHKTLAMTGRYVNRDTDPLRALHDIVGERIAAAMKGEKGEVISLQERKAGKKP